MMRGMLVRGAYMVLSVWAAAMMVLAVGCDSSDEDSGSDTETAQDTGVACGPYVVDVESGLETYVVIRGLWNDGSDYRELIASSTTVTMPGQSRPTGWTLTVTHSSNGVNLGTHTLQYSNVQYSPVSFTLTIDGAYTCSYP